jgi:hypothetical protein
VILLEKKYSKQVSQDPEKSRKQTSMPQRGLQNPAKHPLRKTFVYGCFALHFVNFSA